MQAIVGRRHTLVLCRVRQQVAGELFSQELIVRLVVVESLEHPVAPGPGEHGFVASIAPGVGITRKVHPSDCEVFAVTRRSEQGIDTLLVGVRRLVRDKGVDLGVGRRKARQRKRSTAEEGGTVSGGGRLKASFDSLISDKTVEGVLGP